MIQKYEGPIGIEDQAGLLHQARVLEAFHKVAAMEPSAFYEIFADMTSNDGNGQIPGYPRHRAISVGSRVVGSFVPFVAKESDEAEITEMYGQLHIGDGDDPDERFNMYLSLPEPRIPEIEVHYPAYIRAHKTEGASGVFYVVTADEADELSVPQEDLHILQFTEDIEQLYRNTPVPENTTAFEVMAEAFASLRQYAR